MRRPGGRDALAVVDGVEVALGVFEEVEEGEAPAANDGAPVELGVADWDGVVAPLGDPDIVGGPAGQATAPRKLTKPAALACKTGALNHDVPGVYDANVVFRNEDPPPPAHPDAARAPPPPPPNQPPPPPAPAGLSVQPIPPADQPSPAVFSFVILQTPHQHRHFQASSKYRRR